MKNSVVSRSMKRYLAENIGYLFVLMVGVFFVILGVHLIITNIDDGTRRLQQNTIAVKRCIEQGGTPIYRVFADPATYLDCAIPRKK